MTGFGDVADVASRRTSLFVRGIAALNIATGVGEAALSALTVTVGGLASALTAASIGLGAYGARRIAGVDPHLM